VPRLTHAVAALTRDVAVLDEFGAERHITIPAERALTVFVDNRELVTLMTLGAAPELLVLGYLRNQRLVDTVEDIDSVTVDWEVEAAAVKTRAGIERFDEKTAKRVVTTGCGQGTVFGDLMGELESLDLPAPDEPSARLSQGTLYGLLNTMRLQESTYKSSGSVHGCALFRGSELLMFVEDVGRHNAIDTIAGWMWLHGVGGHDKIFYTTGRLTSEMVIKSAQIGVPIIVSRSGITQMGYELAARLGLALFGRATNKHFICYCGFERFDAEPLPAPAITDAPGRAAS
jgi:FdhD protein